MKIAEMNVDYKNETPIDSLLRPPWFRKSRWDFQHFVYSMGSGTKFGCLKLELNPVRRREENFLTTRLGKL